MAGAGAFLVVYIAVALVRLPYPFELEWMEGGSVVHVQRVIDGQPLYGRPSLEFTPFIYSPFYYYASAVPARVFGNGFVPLRVVSLLSSIGSLAVIALLVHKRTGSGSASFLASCLFAATFKLTGAWFDLARVDSLALFMILAGAYLLEMRTRLTNTAGAAILLFLAFFTKQSSAIAAASLAVAVLMTRRGGDRLLLPSLLGLLIAASVLVMNASTDGWFGYYVFDVPARHPIETSLMTGFWTKDLGSHLPIALIFCIFGLFGLGVSHRESSKRIFDAALFSGLIIASYSSRIHSGGFDNVLMTAAAGVAIFFGIGFSALRTACVRRPVAAITIIAAAGIQLVMLGYSPANMLPASAARAEGEQLLRQVAAVDGEVYLPEHPWYAVAAGKSAQAQTMAVADVLRAGGSEDIRESLASEMRVAVNEERYAAFVVDVENFLLRPTNFDDHYRLADAHLSDDDFLPLTGMRRAPRLLFIRRSRQ